MKINTDKILKDFTSFINNLGKINEPHLGSFCFSIENFDPKKIIDELISNYNDIFFFQTPENKITITGLNSALEFKSETNRFFSIYDQLIYWGKNLIKNWDGISFGSSKIICCAARFDPAKTSKLWSDFEPLRIYIPELIFSFENNKSHVFFNFIINDDKEINVISDNFLHYIKLIKRLDEKSLVSSKITKNSKLTSGKEDKTEWKKTFNESMNFLQNEEVEKLVLSRVYGFHIVNPLDWTSLLNKLSERFHDCYKYFTKRNNSVFFGSSPEMFLRVAGKSAEVESVAGSAPRSKRIESDNQYEKFLRGSEKNRQEHIFVSEFNSDILIQYSDKVKIIEEKQIRKLDNIQHLITRISAELNIKTNTLELIDSLFPTPAVCGVPKEKAMHLIRKLEKHDRGLYSGLIGLIDFKGGCELAVSIRSALFKDNMMNAFAGAGLIKSSNSEEEFLETELKLDTILSLFSDECKSK